MRDQSRDRLPTTAVTMTRVPVYQATRKPKMRTAVVHRTSHGAVIVTGRIGERHQSLMEAITYHALKVRQTRDSAGSLDALDILVDPADLRRALGDWYSYERIRAMLRELQGCDVQISCRRGDTALEMHGALIERWAMETSAPTRCPLPWCDERHLLYIRLGQSYVRLYGADLRRWWDPAIFNSLKSGIARAAARHILAHDKAPRGGWRLDTVIHAVAPDVMGDTLRKRRAEMRDDAARLALLGVLLTRDDRITTELPTA